MPAELFFLLYTSTSADRVDSARTDRLVLVSKFSLLLLLCMFPFQYSTCNNNNPKQMSVSDSEMIANSDEDDIVTGMMDYAGRPARRSLTGYWRSASYILGVGSIERFCYYGIASNLVSYLTGQLGQPKAVAAASINIWTGTGLLLPLLGAFLADSFLGRYTTILFSSLLYFLALGMLTASAVLNSLHTSSKISSKYPNPFEVLFFYVSLYLMALGQGAYKPCILAFGADQFDDRHPQELRVRSSFFNWWYFCISAGPLAALLVLNYIQDNVSWGIVFGIPCIFMLISLLLFFIGNKSYRYSIKVGQKSAVSRVCHVFVKAVMNWRAIPSSATATATASGYDEEAHDAVPQLQYSQQFKFLNKALLAPDGSMGYDGVCSIREVEEARALMNLFPIWATSLGYATVLAQPSTLFTEQGITLDKSIGAGFDIPAASLQYVIGISVILLIPMYDRLFVPVARMITGNPSGITNLQRIGTGMVICIICMVTAALVEKKRLETAEVYGLEDKTPNTKLPMSFWWLTPQYILYGISEVFTLVGLQELFYDQVPGDLRSVGLSLFLSICGMGNFLSSFLICIIERSSSGKDGNGGWFSDNTNRAHLDYFYWLLAGVNALGFVAFLCFAKSLNCNN